MSAIYYFVLAGLCEGVKLDVFYPGFPTMYHVAHEVLMRFLFWKKLNLFIGLSLRFRFTFRIHFFIMNKLGIIVVFQIRRR